MYKILVIDDKQENLYVIKEIISERLDDTQVFSKPTGNEGIKCAIKELPDVILLDLMMPVMDGFEVCSKLKSNNKTKHIPIVIISGMMTDAESKIRALELGADSFLTKPIGPTELVAQIKAMIRIKKAEDKLREENLILGSIVNKASKKIDFTLKRYQNIFDNNIAGVVETTFDGKIISCNSAFAEMLGFESVEEVLENKIYSFYRNKNEREKITSILKEQKEVLNYEVEAINKNGKPSSVLFRSFNIEDKYILSFIIDITNIKETEKELRKSRQRLANHLDNTPLGAIFWDINFKVTEWNLSAERIFGYTKNEALGKPANELIIPEEIHNKTDKLFKQLTSKKGSEKSTYENINKKGKRILCEWYNVAITDINGKVTGVASLVDDITEKMKIKERLKESEQHYRNLFNSINDLVCIHDLEGNILSMNPAVEKNLGYKMEEVLNRNLSDLLAPEVKNQFKDYLYKVIKDGKARGFMVVQTRTGEKRIWEYNNSLVKTEDNKQFISGLGRDVTDVKKIETDLLESEASLKEAQKIANIGNWTRELTGELYWSDQQYRIYGYEPGEIKPNIEIAKSHVHPEDLSTFTKCIEEAIKTRQPFELEYRLISKNGTQKFVHAHANVELDKSNNPIRLRGILQDITERKKMTEELIKAKDKAEELYRLKSNLLANMSHELRTPLVGILGFTEILEESIKDEELKEYASLINENGSRLLETLNLILNLSKIESEKTKIEFTYVNVVKEVKKCVKLFEKAALKKRLFIKIKYRDEKIILSSDIRMFNEIINNLINNAIKYTKEGGITVYVNKTDDNKYVKIEVKDTGIGIPKEKQNLIWEEFRQVSEGASRMFEGTGLGLTITNKFVKLLEGKISLESETGIGSTFTVIFPLNNHKQFGIFSEKILNNKSSKIEGIKKRKQMLPILYIEDDKIARSVVTLFLKGLYDVELAENGLEGLEKTKHTKYEIILMDINLKIKPDGVETFNKIKETEDYKTTPVIAVTAYAMSEDREKYLNIGFSNYISKPFTKNDLIDLLKTYSPKK